MIHWLLTNPYWLAAQGVIQNSTVVGWMAMGWGLAKVHAHVSAHHKLLREIHAKVHETP